MTTKSTSVRLDEDVDKAATMMSERLDISKSAFIAQAVSLLVAHLTQFDAPQDWIDRCTPIAVQRGSTDTPIVVHSPEFVRNKLLRPGDTTAMRALIEEIAEMGSSYSPDEELEIVKTQRKMNLLRELNQMREKAARELP